MTPDELTVYRTIIRPQLRAGDVLAFFGSGFLSGLIRLFASGPSHVAWVRQAAHANSGGPTIIESTIENGKDGVQTNDLDRRLKDYPGSVAWLQLSDESRRKLDLQKYYAFCGACDGLVRYDTAGLFEFLLREVPVVGARIAQAEDPTEMLCSSFGCALWQASDLLGPGINWMKQKPQDIVEMGLYSRAVSLVGKPKLTRFNTV